MNYYERHLGDYARDTTHLTMLEHGAYTLLLDRYYATEKPIEKGSVYRYARAQLKEERDAVDAVLREFFTLDGEVYRNARADFEIETARGRIEAAKANGRRGGRPRKNPEVSAEEPSGNPALIENETQRKPNPSKIETQQKALQSPDTNHQSRAPTRGSTRCPADFQPDLEFARRQLPDLDAEAEAEKFRDFEFSKPRKDWPATWRNWIRQCRDSGRYARRRNGPDADRPFAHLDMR